MLLSEALMKFYLSLEANGRRPRTIGSYRQRLAGFSRFLSAQGIDELGRITAEVMDAWVVSLRRQSERYADHGRRPSQRGGLSEVTISGRIQAVKSFCAWCVERGLLESSPARHLKRPQVGHSAVSKAMAAGDLELLLAEAERRAEAGQPRDLAGIWRCCVSWRIPDPAGAKWRR